LFLMPPPLQRNFLSKRADCCIAFTFLDILKYSVYNSRVSMKEGVTPNETYVVEMAGHHICIGGVIRASSLLENIISRKLTLYHNVLILCFDKKQHTVGSTYAVTYMVRLLCGLRTQSCMNSHFSTLLSSVPNFFVVRVSLDSVGRAKESLSLCEIYYC